jgi:poly(hydroxyalkanoate) depolymerase family esterase
MRLSETISRLSRIRGELGKLPSTRAVSGRLSELPQRFDNPGDLRGFYHVPEGIAHGAPLVVVLHGCTQNASGYDRGSGWSNLADRHGFALLFPEQQRSNNMNLCFNWYQPEDIARGKGEAESIRAMVAQMVEAHHLDPARIFVTGLSAGGAMTSVMLAAYPDVFAAGAIIAGLPFGAADTLGEALGEMSSPGEATSVSLGNAVRRASAHRGPWPRVSVWHGSADRLVMPGNGKAIVRQWRDVHDLPVSPTRTAAADGYPRRIWEDKEGNVLVEEYVVTGMGHGTPLMPGNEEGQSGQVGPHMLDVGLSSTDRIAAFFGIAPEPAVPRERPVERPQAAPRPQTTPANDVQSVIEDALRSAGLMR